MTRLVGYAHRCNNEVNSVRVTNHFLIRFKTHIPKRNLPTYQGHQAVVTHIVGPGREPAAITLRMGHSIEQVHDDLAIPID